MNPHRTVPIAPDQRTAPVHPDRTVPVPPRSPQQPWYLAYRRHGPDHPLPDQPPAPPRRSAPVPQALPRSPVPPPVQAPPPTSRPPAPAVATPQRKSVAARSDSARRLLIATTAVLFVIAAVLVAVLVNRFSGDGTTELDVTAAQEGVLQVLTDPIDGYGRDGVTDVSCNDGRNPIVKQGTGFTCTVTVERTRRQVAVEFTDDAGTYEVDRPR